MASSSSTTTKTYLHAAAYSGVGGALSRGLQGLVPVVAARLLTPQQFGSLNVVLSVVVMVTTIANFGQSTALQRFLPLYRVKDRQRGGAILVTTVILNCAVLGIGCAAIFILSRWLAGSVYHDQTLVRLLQAAALIVFAVSLFNLATSVLAGLQEFEKFNTALVLRGASLLGFTVVGTWIFGLAGAVAAQIIASVLAAWFTLSWANGIAQQRFSGGLSGGVSRDVLRELLNYSLPAILASAVVAPAYWWSTAFLVRNSGLQQMGSFGVAFALCQLVLLVPMTVSAPALSYMAERHTRDGEVAFAEFVGRNFRLIWALTLPISLGVALFSPLVVRLVFGSAYELAILPAVIMSFTALSLGLNGVIGNALTASGKIWAVFWINLAWLVGFVAACLLLVPGRGAIGLAQAFFTSYCFFTIGICIYSRQSLGLRFGFPQFGYLIVLSVLCVPAILNALHTSGIGVSVFNLCLLLGLILTEWFLVLDKSERQRLLCTARSLLYPRRPLSSEKASSSSGSTE